MTLKLRYTARGPVLTQSAFVERRALYRGFALEPNSLAIFVSNPEQTRSNDTEYPYRQSSDMLYLTGFPEPESVVILSNIMGEPDFIMLVRPKDKVKERWDGERVGIDGARKIYGALQAFPIAEFSQVVEALLKKAERVYYRFGRNPEFDQQFRKLWEPEQKPLLNPETLLHDYRMVKTNEELVLLRHAADISAQAHREAMHLCEPGVWENEIQAALEGVFLSKHASGPSYGSIVAGGHNATTLHYVSNNRQLQDGDLLLIDAACEYEGYAADITRTIPISGRFSAAQAEIYQLVLNAQLAVIKAIRPGVTLGGLHAIAQLSLLRGLRKLGILPRARSKPKGKTNRSELTLEDLFMHGTSHGLGLDVHDVGRYQGKRNPSGLALSEAMVITVEPGLYFDPNDKRIPKRYRGIGVRIEDDVVVTANGAEVISAGVPKTIAEIEALMNP